MTLADHAADLFGLGLTAEQTRQFDILLDELLRWNAHTNLTAITEPEAVRVRHFLDSLSVARALPLAPGTRLVDVGTGAGFPGLPLALVYPQVHVTLMDATGKKVAFVQHIIDQLGLKNAAAVHIRAEEAGQSPQHRGRYDVVVARAVARLPGLVEYLLPLCTVGGVCIAMKGTTAREEAATAARALNILGGTLERIETVQLPRVEIPHHLVVIKKVTPTPRAYPRRPGIPTREPLD